MGIRVGNLDLNALEIWQLRELLTMEILLSYAKTNDGIAQKEIEAGEKLTMELSVSDRHRYEIVVWEFEKAIANLSQLGVRDIENVKQGGVTPT